MALEIIGKSSIPTETSAQHIGLLNEVSKMGKMVPVWERFSSDNRSDLLLLGALC